MALSSQSDLSARGTGLTQWRCFSSVSQHLHKVFSWCPGFVLHISHKNVPLLDSESVSYTSSMTVVHSHVFILVYYCLNWWTWDLQLSGNCTNRWAAHVEVHSCFPEVLLDKDTINLVHESNEKTCVLFLYTDITQIQKYVNIYWSITKQKSLTVKKKVFLWSVCKYLVSPVY